MKTKRILATLLLLTTLTACAPSAEPSTEPSAEPSATTSTVPSASPEPTTTVPTAVTDYDYNRYINPLGAYYPEWAQPYSVYKYDKQEGESVQGKFSLGGYLTKEQLAKEPAKMEHFMDYEYMTPAKSYTMVSYDEDGHIMLDSLLYRYLNGSYHKEPPTEEEKPQPYAPPQDPSSPITSSPLAVLPYSEDDIKLSYEEYFSVPRYVEPWYNNPRDGAYEILYELTPETEEILAQYDIISGIHGNEVVLFFMDSNYDVYRLHLPSGTVDFMCNTAFDFEAAHEWHREFRNYCDWLRRTWSSWYIEDEEEFEKEYARLDAITYEEWDEEKYKQPWANNRWELEENQEMPDCGTLEILSNNDVRFTVLAPDWLPYRNEEHPTGDPPYDSWSTDWFSHIMYGTGSYFYGDYVTYSAALGKYGATDRALDLLGIPEEQRMTFDEFREYYGGTPPHSDI